MADDLTVKRFAGESSSTSEAYANVLKFVAESGYEVGGHTDTHTNGEASGCGANDKLESIYSFIANNGDHLRTMSEFLGVSTSDEACNQIIENASSRTDFSSGRSLLNELEQQDGSDIDELVGDHKEVVAVINTKPGTTLDRVLPKK
ncbi:hypothetical protein KDA06_03820 [Candidatus Saccharibacteria bacterium]|nr:hypothetical protein [Candidatus Saccharibacteria bacterium]